MRQSVRVERNKNVFTRKGAIVRNFPVKTLITKIFFERLYWTLFLASFACIRIKRFALRIRDYWENFGIKSLVSIEPSAFHFSSIN